MAGQVLAGQVLAGQVLAGQVLAGQVLTGTAALMMTLHVSGQTEEMRYVRLI